MKSVILVAVLSLVILISGCSAVTTTATNTVTTTVNNTTTVAVTQTTTAPASTVTVTATVTQTVTPTVTPTPKPVVNYAEYTVDQLLLQVTPVSLSLYASKDVEVTGIVAMLTINNSNIREIRLGAVNTAGDAILKYHLYAFNLAERGILVDPTGIKVGDKVKIRGTFLGILAAPPPAGTSLEKLIMTLDGISKTN
jgi:hypothetical protein